ncbi:MAG: nucleotidyl transferase AbiEii/AbiGii toxin family protein [Ignavibacteriaceae bacterium]|jgi:predicted nucleotidyltransferase component of viral defense system|nr:nucleotidyl transferase AbiEii/AbiGii toxin family protein [Bacteroidales bacterium]MDY0084173.1 nucleotidyl transferase AbiEii/AbiGii toxin family protein [Ignavibacteriaceae bacterium]
MDRIINDKNAIKAIADQSKFEIIVVEKVLHMERILHKISESELLRNDFALMGGSAIVFLYGNVYRLSVDLDLDFINNPNLGKDDRGEIRELQRKHIGEFQRIAGELNMGFEEIPPDDERFIQLKMNYNSVVYASEYSVELDLGYRYCSTIFGVQEVSWPNHFKIEDFPKISIQTFSPAELWASKIIAMISTRRKDFKGNKFLGFKNKIRHLYDTWYLLDSEHMLKSVDFNDLKNLTLLFGMTRIENYEFCRGEIISLYSQENYDNDLHPVLINSKDTPRLIAMQRRVRKFLDQKIFCYNKADYDFMEKYVAGLFRPEDLFGDELGATIKSFYFYREMTEMLKR